MDEEDVLHATFASETHVKAVILLPSTVALVINGSAKTASCIAHRMMGLQIIQ